ncbi:MAG: hypothetical protein QOJ35_4177 [Solirubrobacteraceae bacterium]|jgi:hypothetical protein|nr:hypothetical protein [Solirubrobacteraceae bacterium]
MSPQAAADARAAGPPPRRGAAAIAGRPRIVAVAVLASAASATVAAGWDSPVRAALVLAFLVFGPGLAIAELLHVDDLAEQIALIAGASLAIDTLVSVGLLYLGVYTYQLAFAIVVAITATALGAGVVRARTSPAWPGRAAP